MKFTKIILSLLIFSLMINIGFLYVHCDVVSQIVVKSDTDPSLVVKVYDLTKYKSSSYEKKNLQERLDRLYNEYLKDKANPKESYYIDGNVDPYWVIKCAKNIKRITVIMAKIDMLESVLNFVVDNQEKMKQELDVMIEKKAYRDKLLDMSNFYAQFLTEEQYQYAQTTID